MDQNQAGMMQQQQFSPMMSAGINHPHNYHPQQDRP